MAGNQLIASLANKAGVTEQQYYNTLMKTIMPSGNVSPEHVLAFLQVAGKYRLDPLTREIFAFPAKGGGIQPVVSVDGWISLANREPDMDGMVHDDILDDQGNLVAVKCSVYRKGRAHPVTATEYMDECRRNTEPWKQWPRRMLRHKATIQALRYAYGFAGIMEPDEAERWHDAPVVEVASGGNGGTAALKERVGVQPDEQTEDVAPEITADALLAKVAEAKANKHIANIVNKYGKTAEQLGIFDDFMAAADLRREELSNGEA